MKVNWTDRAKTRLRLIHEYIAADSPIVANQVVERLVNRSRQIGELPSSGRAIPEFQRTDVRELLERPYRIIYRIMPDRIDILTVLHYRQLLPQDLKS